MSSAIRVLLGCVCVLVVGASIARPSTETPRPNVVLIVTDNQGAWTLGCYGNRDIHTPNIDRLASEGMRFTRCFSSNGVCSPTRATLLTGLIPSQHGVHCYLGAGSPQIGPDAYDTIGEFRTLPRILAEAGYTCGMVGKWHLGDNRRPQEGFTYWVTMPHGHTKTFYDAEVIAKEKIRKEPTYLTDFWTKHAVRFLEENRSRPFFLYLPYNGPYGLGPLLLRPARNRHAEEYADQELPSFPRKPIHPWLLNNRNYINNPLAMRRYAAEISGVDDGVGRVLQTLQKLDLEKNTLVIFTADQGLCGGQNGIWGMGDHSRPINTFDNGILVPMICRMPGVIAPGSTSDLMVSNYDVLPTVLDLLGMKDKTPTQPELPGRDYAAVLRGQSTDWENVVFYEFENTRMIRTPRWKLTKRAPNGPDELYDLEADPEESNNLAGKPRCAEVEAELTSRLKAFFDRYANPRYDLWRGGVSKSPLLTYPKQRGSVRPPSGQ